MKKLQKLITFSLLAIAITSCQVTPEASFTTDKTEYVAGETIKLTNTTLNGKTYKWTFPDGQTGDVQNYDYKTNDTDPTATLNFKLEAFSSNGKKTDEVSKTVSLKAAEGNVSFWVQTGTAANVVTVQLNGISGNITNSFSSAPSCGQAGCAVFNGVKVGTYNYTATDGTNNWTGNVTVTKNGCNLIQLVI